jgi:glycosyltransferase involved in cell wall biosynthesis
VTQKSVTILLATYDGAPHLPAQLDSLLAQTHADWHLLVRDDGSTDATPSILADYRARFPDRIAIVSDDGRRLGACGNFALLMAAADADYIMFCDQDDVWLPEKIERTLAAMRALERVDGAGTPLLVHTDLQVVDERVQTVADSLWRFQRSDPVKGTVLNRLLVQNAVTGCTVMINRPLRDLALPLPAAAVMHDWWLALVAAAFGAIGRVPQATILYRQHRENDTGARQWGVDYAGQQLTRLGEQRSIMTRLQRQGAAFLERYRDRLTPARREMLSVYARLDSCNGLLRRWYLVRYRFFYTGFVRNVGRLIIG